MNKKIIYLAILSLLTFSKSSHAQLIAWQPGIKLTWSDFVATLDPKSNYWAYTYTLLNYKWTCDTYGNVTVTVDCSLDLSKSWKRTDKNLTPALLQHEQLHFDIAELHARKLRQAFDLYTAYHKYSPALAGDLKKIFDKIIVESNGYNALYDNESDHSLNKLQQWEWNKKITADLWSLSIFASKK